MKRIVFFLLLFSSCLYGQGNKFTISGVVTDCKTKEAIPEVTVKLIGSDNNSINVKTDSFGYYSFSDCFKNNVNYVIVVQCDNNVGRGTIASYGMCQGTFYEKAGYSGSSDKEKFTYSDTLPKQKIDFCFAPLIACGPLPTFYFKKNSCEFEIAEWINEESADTLVDCFVAFLMAHKTWAVELSGHSSSGEKDRKELAEARAKKFFDVLVSKGIDKERLVYKSYSDSKPAGYFSDEKGKWIENDKKNERNRRIDIGLLRSDYDPITKKPRVEKEEDKRFKELEENED